MTNEIKRYDATELGQIDAGDITIPRLVLAQGQSDKRPDHIVPGDWYNTVTEEVYGKDVWVVPITMYKTRVLFGKEVGDPAACMSADTQRALDGYDTPAGPRDEPASSVCATCGWSKFPEKDKDGKLKWKGCALIWNYVVGVQHDGGMYLCVVGFKRTASKFGKSIANTAANLGLAQRKFDYKTHAWNWGSAKEKKARKHLACSNDHLAPRNL